jgi:glutamyl-Q tRNA(Asp) synthetase
VTRPPAYRGRFAPSPTGALHFGSLVAAFASWLRARQAGGTWLVRVENLDPPREVAGAAEQQLRALQAFGLESDEPVVWQSERDDLYQAALQSLLARDLAFACRCSRSDLAAQHGIHRFCVAASHTRRPAFRARVPDARIGFDDLLQGHFEQNLAQEVGDFVLRRVEGFAAYQLAVVVDDAAQGITEIVRGYDLFDSTPRQIWLQRALGLPTPRYLHLPLAVDEAGRKLAKSLAALPLVADDPKPALQAAWRFLQPAAAALDGGNVDLMLERAIQAFRLDAIPAASALPAITAV